jgi:hypothetical protein
VEDEEPPVQDIHVHIWKRAIQKSIQMMVSGEQEIIVDRYWHLQTVVLLWIIMLPKYQG